MRFSLGDASLQRITLSSFRRITRSGNFIPEVDGLRFIAILSVVFLHCYYELLNRSAIGSLGPDGSQNVALPVDPANQHGLLRLLGHGGYGVELFFAISGFILAWPFARQHLQAGRKVKLGSYFLRRVTRLEPPYILMLLIRTVLLLVTQDFTRFASCWSPLVGQYLLHPQYRFRHSKQDRGGSLDA